MALPTAPVTFLAIGEYSGGRDAPHSCFNRHHNLIIPTKCNDELLPWYVTSKLRSRATTVLTNMTAFSEIKGMKKRYKIGLAILLFSMFGPGAVAIVALLKHFDEGTGSELAQGSTPDA